jgi:LAGLIDADG endonuclease
VGSPRDPVTTDPNSPQGEGGEIAGSIHHRMDKSKITITRRPQKCIPAHFKSYLSGFVDGEGCFTVSVSPRSKMRIGWELRPSFSVSQNYDRAETLYLMADYFACGTIRPDRSDNTLKYEVRSLRDLIGRVIPHFEEYPLLSSKQRSFEVFSSICLDMAQGKHLSPDHIQQLLISAEMINGGKRKYKFGKI